MPQKRTRKPEKIMPPLTVEEKKHGVSKWLEYKKILDKRPNWQTRKQILNAIYNHVLRFNQ